MSTPTLETPAPVAVPPVAPTRAWYKKKHFIGYTAAILVSLGVGSAMAGGTTTVTVPGPAVTVAGPATNTTPQACLDALTTADQVFTLAGTGFTAAADGFSAVSNLDAAGMTAATGRMTDAASQITALAPSYKSAKAACQAQ
jgi:hypothetical protein